MNDCHRFGSKLTIACAPFAEPNMKNIRQRTLGFILMGIGIALLAAGVYELGQTDEFRSAARIKLEVPDRSRFTEMVAEPKDPYAECFQADTEAILSDSILSNVVYRLELREKWGKKHFNSESDLRMERNQRVLETGKIKTAEAVRLMRERQEVIRVPNTMLLEIAFVGDDADEAANIANMVAEVYRGWRIEQGRRLAQGGIEALKAQIKIEDEKIKAAKEELQRLSKELSIPDAEVESVSVRTNFPKYWDAKMNFERLNDVQRLITRKLNIEEIDLNYPLRYSPVEIIEPAVPAKTPTRRHRPLGAALTLVGLALFGYGLVSVWNSRPSRRHDPPS